MMVGWGGCNGWVNGWGGMCMVRMELVWFGPREQNQGLRLRTHVQQNTAPYKGAYPTPTNPNPGPFCSPGCTRPPPTPAPNTHDPPCAAAAPWRSLWPRQCRAVECPAAPPAAGPSAGQPPRSAQRRRASRPAPCPRPAQHSTQRVAQRSVVCWCWLAAGWAARGGCRLGDASQAHQPLPLAATRTQPRVGPQLNRRRPASKFAMLH